jgi:hypothetical protein
MKLLLHEIGAAGRSESYLIPNSCSDIRAGNDGSSTAQLISGYMSDDIDHASHI